MVKYLSKSAQVFLYQMYVHFFSARTLVVFALLFVYMNRTLRPIAEYCYTMKHAITPWIFPFLVNDYICQAFLIGGSIMLLSEIPFNEYNGMYMLQRTGTTAWKTGTIWYVLGSAALYVMMLWSFTIMNLWDVMSFSRSWGKVLTHLANSGEGANYGITITFSPILLQFTAGKACVLAIFLEILCIVWIGLLMYFVNDLLGKKTGMILAFIYMFLDAMISNVMSAGVYRFSPIVLSQLSYYNGDMARNGVTMKYALCFFFCGYILFGILIMWKEISKRRIKRLQQKMKGKKKNE